MLLTSLQNPRVKEVVKLRRRSHRNETGLLIVEGYREISRFLDSGRKPAAIFYCPGLYEDDSARDLVARCGDADAELLECEEHVFRKIAYRERPNGLLVLAELVGCGLNELHLPERPLLLVVEHIEKPGNLGTMLRTADGAGVDAVIVCDQCTDINNPNIVRASTGTLFTVPVAEASSEETVAWLKRRDISILAATPDADTLYSDTDLAGSVAIVMGEEQKGLTDEWLNAANQKVRIPMLGKADSLNVSAAATILLYEAVRQRS
ncbi:MAG: RNA methyltransferase [Verrucomicrobia bacterium]|nr:RNA methyltransferase [Verrucomicrobiota bacterium]